jgi:dTDP-4-dehydrorhamnose reductase
LLDDRPLAGRVGSGQVGSGRHAARAFRGEDSVLASVAVTGARATALLTGASGLLGTWLRRCAPPDVGVVSVVHRRQLPGEVVMADLRDRRAVQAAFTAARPGLVIHAGYARDDTSIVEATRHVADMAADVRADLLFVSSESVFSGDGRPRSETSRPDPVWDYGRWKVAAEEIVRSSKPDATIVRLPLIISLAPEDNILTDIRRGLERGDLSVWFTDEMRQPANAADLARGIWAIASLPTASRAGIWHLPGPERLSRSEMAARALDAVGLDRSSIITAPTPPGAQRPRDLNLTGSRAERQINWAPRPIHSM